MAYHTRVRSDEQAMTAFEVNGVMIAVSSKLNVHLFIECDGKPVRRVSRPANMTRSRVSAQADGSSQGRGPGFDPD